MAMGQMTFQDDCEANIGNFLAKTQTNISKLQLKLCKTIEIRKKLQDLKAETIWVGYRDILFNK